MKHAAFILGGLACLGLGAGAPARTSGGVSMLGGVGLPDLEGNTADLEGNTADHEGNTEERRGDQRPLTEKETEHLNGFLVRLDESIVEGDLREYLELFDLGAIPAATARFEWMHDGLEPRAAESKVVEAWRLRDRICALVQTRLEIESARESHGIRVERIENQMLLLRDEQTGLRVVRFSRERASATARTAIEPGSVHCEACNFGVEPSDDWFVLHQEPVDASFTEKFSLHHSSGQAIVEIQVLELPEPADPKSSLLLDHDLSALKRGLTRERLTVIDASPVPALPGAIPGYRMQATLPRPDGGEDLVARCYFARGNVLYQMTAVGEAEAFFADDAHLLDDVESMFDSFGVVDLELSQEAQHERMLAHHRPGIQAEGNRFHDQSTGCSMAGPTGWTTRPLPCRRVRWMPPRSTSQGQMEYALPTAWLELTWQAEESGWTRKRIGSAMRSWEKAFARFPEVKRGSFRILDRARTQIGDPQELLIAERFWGDYSYFSERGTKRRTRVYYIPVGKMLFVVRADASAKDFEGLEEEFHRAVASFTLR